jgi:hypothetical protein
MDQEKEEKKIYWKKFKVGHEDLESEEKVGKEANS